ncbi:hypothetical protein PBAL39_01787 [Pedobacter sp. BAL39]|uniref:hypothetical protein n=1 Tax=Pedobacter sp. BAL39 TaxID=391596 RepID=UPI00015599A0|nr:hypothetical protein [Pedobacter sp. BAL39]EDM38306.1 hypothetical protein PBAL39_01787 [Pedobacter sp. BAL39]
MSLIKDIYSHGFYNRFAALAQTIVPDFDPEKFVNECLSPSFETMEWKARMQHTTAVLRQFMPADFAEATPLLLKLVETLTVRNFGVDSFVFMFLPDYIAAYGLEDFGNSTQLLERFTMFVSCEFAVRPFLLKYPEEMMEVMVRFSKHQNHKVRRFASEGSRPRLPWAMAIPSLKKNPAPLIPLLENLKNDPSEWVRRSVANNLNDISKDHPDLVIEIARRWSGVTKETDAIIKHGCRTLLKQGHIDVLALYGLSNEGIEVLDFEIITPVVAFGESVEFKCMIRNHTQVPRMIRLEYGLYYQKANGQLNRKVFKISEKVYDAGITGAIFRKQSFKAITTRLFHPGAHAVSIIVNGIEIQTLPFELKA